MTRYMKKIMMLVAAGAVLISCGSKEKEYDATGTFEATETIVYAEQSGRLLAFDVTEGSSLQAGQEVGLVDTAQLYLRILQLEATKHVFSSQKPDTQTQIAATREQLAKALLEQRRYGELVKDGAAPRKTYDDATNQVNVLRRQLAAQTSSLNTQTASLDAQQRTTDTQISQLRDQLRKCHVKSPIHGNVLEKYVEPGEFVTMGKPLFKVADTGNMFIRAYVTSLQLQKIRTGQQVTVASDYGDKQGKTYPGTITWISDKSEFTPKTILTDDERADLVYAVKISVKNDGYLKIGMYGKVKF